MKKYRIIFAVLIILMVILSFAACTKKDANAAKVNDRIITVKELDQYFPIFLQAQYIDENTLKKDKQKLNEFKSQAVDDLVNMEVIREYYDKRKVNVIPAEAETEYKTFYDQITGNETSKKFLTENKITDEFLKKMYFNKYYTLKLYDEVTADMGDTTGAALSYYNTHKQEFYKEEVRASHILVDTEAKAKKVLAEIKSGKDFAELAKEYSKDSGTAQNGGDLNFFTKDQMVKEFSDAAFKLKVGEVSDVVKTEFGYHIIKLTDKRNGYMPFDEAKADIISKLTDELYIKKLKEIRSTMKVETYPKNYETK